MRPPELLIDMLESAPTSDVDREARWAAAVEAVARVYPALLKDGGAAVQDARILRIAFEAIDVFVFHASFRALFDFGDRAVWCWGLDRSDAPCDAWLESDEIEGSRELGDGWQQSPEIVFEFVVNATRLATAFPTGGPGRFDDRDAGSLLEAIVGAIGRRMLRLAACHGTSHDAEADAAERLLIQHFGDGPRVAAPGPLRPGAGDAP